MAGIGGISRVTAASVRLGNDAAGKILSASRMPGGKVNLDAVAAGIAYLVKTDPKAAAVATEAIAKQLPPVQRGQLPREISEAVRAEQRSAQSVPPGLTGAQKELMLDLGQIGLDIVGLVDPTPVSDGLNGIISLFRGDFLGAGISAVSMIPYIGDAAKLGKLGKWSKTIDRAMDIARAAPNSAMSKALRPAIAKIADGLNSIPASVLNKLPASAKKQILDMRAKANAFLGGAGKAAVRQFSDAVLRTAERLGIPPEKVQHLLDLKQAGKAVPAPSTYMSKKAIAAHLKQFDEGAIRITSRSKFLEKGTLGPTPGFVFPKSQFDRLMKETGGNLRALETKLGLPKNYLKGGDTLIAFVERKNIKGLNIPSGNEPGANALWLPGGVTSGGVIEAVLSLPKGTPFKEIKLGR